MPRILGIFAALALLGGAAYWFVHSEPIGITEIVQTEEEGAEEEISLVTPEELLIGVWQSEGDLNFTREFRADGSVVDTYTGEEMATVLGQFEIFSSGDPLEAPFSLEEGNIYVRVSSSGENFHFLVSEISEEHLELIYMDRGGVLSFTRK